MYGGDEFLRISRFDNGFTVEIKDPGIVKFNKKRDSINQKPNTPYVSYKDPWRSFVFATSELAQTFISKNIGKAITAANDEDSESYETAFDIASAAPIKESK